MRLESSDRASLNDDFEKWTGDDGETGEVMSSGSDGKYGVYFGLILLELGCRNARYEYRVKINKS